MNNTPTNNTLRRLTTVTGLCLALGALTGQAADTDAPRPAQTPRNDANRPLEFPVESPERSKANPGADNNPTGSYQDKEITVERFLNEAIAGGRREVRLSNLAVQKTQNSEVRDFAQKMVTDHGMLNQELAALAQRKGITLPSDRMDKDPATVARDRGVYNENTKGRIDGTPDANDITQNRGSGTPGALVTGTPGKRDAELNKPNQDNAPATTEKPVTPTPERNDRGLYVDTDTGRNSSVRAISTNSANQRLEHRQPGQARDQYEGTDEERSRMSYQRLQGATGDDFDRQYLQAIVKDHGKAVKCYENASRTLTDPEVKRFATENLSKLRDHQRMASDLARQKGVNPDDQVSN